MAKEIEKKAKPVDSAKSIAKKRKRKHARRGADAEEETPKQQAAAVANGDGAASDDDSEDENENEQKKTSSKETMTKEKESSRKRKVSDSPSDEEDDEEKSQSENDDGDGDEEEDKEDEEVANDKAGADLPSVDTVRLPQTEGAPQKFSDLNLSDKTMKAIGDMGFHTMTEIQQRTIAPLLAGRDVLGAAKTGSGKTLAFLTPAVEMLSALRFKPRNGKRFFSIPHARQLTNQVPVLLSFLPPANWPCRSSVSPEN